MDVKVLVVYASKYGSTAEIAEKIGEVLERSDPLLTRYVKELVPDASKQDLEIPDKRMRSAEQGAPADADKPRR